MKLATLPNGTRDGALHVVTKALTMAVNAAPVARTLQGALDEWHHVEHKLRELAQSLEAGTLRDAFPFDPATAMAPLPRAYTFLDGSAYLNHVELVRKARGADMPPSFYTDPLMYQGCSDTFLAPHAPIAHASEEQGIDFESEIVVILGDVPQATTAAQAAPHVKLIGLVNDVTLRNLVPNELAKQFGFLVSKPNSALSPVFVTPDELGTAWRDGKLHLPLTTWLNNEKFGDPDGAQEMHFSFHQLIAHAAQTRPLCAGSILGAGTASMKDRSRGSSCLAEKRTIEKLDTGNPVTPFLKFGDRVRIEMFNGTENVFGTIDQVVQKSAGRA